jgi:hypothetical protein
LDLAELTPDVVLAWAKARGLEGVTADACSLGAFNPIDGIVLAIGGDQAFFPKISASEDPLWRERHQYAEANAALWEKVEWFSPFWVPRAATGKVLADARNVSKTRAIEMFNYHMSTTYTLAFQAVCIAQIMPKAPSLEAVCPLAREASRR